MLEMSAWKKRSKQRTLCCGSGEEKEGTGSPRTIALVDRGGLFVPVEGVEEHQEGCQGIDGDSSVVQEDAEVVENSGWWMACYQC